MLTFAYNLRDYQLAGMPGWAGSEHYDILAKPSPGDAAKEPDPTSEAAQNRLRRRTQTLLADRFAVVVAHMETRDTPVLILVAAKGGLKLTPAQTQGPPQIGFNNIRVLCKGITMKQFADLALSARTGRPVVDQTGVSGRYDLHMEFAPGCRDLQEQLGLRLETSNGPTPFLVVDKVERPSAN